MTKKIYLDHAAATPVDPRVERVVLKYMKTFGNPSSLHGAGRKAKEVLESSRKRVAKVLNCRPEEIVFTGSGTESANLVIFGVARAYRTRQNPALSRKELGLSEPRGHIMTTTVEHHAVLRACQYLEKYEGFGVTYLDVKPNGIVDPQLVHKALRPDTVLVSIMCANNEIGTIQPISEISKLVKNFRSRKSEIRKIGNWKLEIGNS